MPRNDETLLENETIDSEEETEMTPVESVELKRLWPSGGFDAALVFAALCDDDVEPFLKSVP